MMRTLTASSWALVASVALGAGFGLGRFTASVDPPRGVETATERTRPDVDAHGSLAKRQGDDDEKRRERTSSAPPEQGKTTDDVEDNPAPATTAPSDVRAQRPSASGRPCEAELEETRVQLATLEKRRKELEGEPLAPRTNTAPRFQAPGLVKTFDRAFALTKIVGKVESVDCTEHPCILFGRLQGDEEGVAKLEDAEPFSAYDSDVGVMLTWASADHEIEGTTKPGLEREKPPEISLFAFAYYTHEERAQHGEMIDRRIRVRTAEYWNASTVRE